MLIPEKKHRDGVGIAVRLKGYTNKLASDVCNNYWKHACNKGGVLYGVTALVDTVKWGNITKVFMFANNNYERFICVADVKKVIVFNTKTNPAKFDKTAKKYLLPEEESKQAKTWFLLSNFRQVDINSCNLRCLKEPDLLFRDKIQVGRFSVCFISLEN